MTTRAEELARQFSAANREFIATVDAVSEDDWQNLCPAENWTVGVTAHHVAYGYPLLMDVMQALTNGESRPITMEMIDDLNAEHARTFAGCTKAETLSCLRDDGAKAESAIRGLSDADLEATHDLPLLGSDPVTLEQFVRALFIGHHALHLPSIRSASPSASALHMR